MSPPHCTPACTGLAKVFLCVAEAGAVAGAAAARAGGSLPRAWSRPYAFDDSLLDVFWVALARAALTVFIFCILGDSSHQDDDSTWYDSSYDSSSHSTNKAPAASLASLLLDAAAWLFLVTKFVCMLLASGEEGDRFYPLAAVAAAAVVFALAHVYTGYTGYTGAARRPPADSPAGDSSALEKRLVSDDAEDAESEPAVDSGEAELLERLGQAEAEMALAEDAREEEESQAMAAAGDDDGGGAVRQRRSFEKDLSSFPLH